VDLHGNLSQPARDRNLAAFTAGTARVLVATDIAARGVHVDDVELVVHCDPPAEHKAYLHRSGRTARAGRAGDVVTVVLPEQRKDTQVLLRKAGIKATPQPVTADLSRRTGARRGFPHRRETPPPAKPPLPQRRPGNRAHQRRQPAGPAKPRSANRRRASRAAGAAAGYHPAACRSRAGSPAAAVDTAHSACAARMTRSAV
jgi:superfamily II DNA/RNA helicase